MKIFFIKNCFENMDTVKVVVKSLMSVCIIGMLILSSCNDVKQSMEISHFAYYDDTEGKWGIVDVKGNVILKPHFMGTPSVVTDGCFFVERLDGSYELHKVKEPEKIVSANYLSYGSFNEGLAPVVVKGNDNISYIDKDGEVILNLPDNIDQAFSFNNGLAIVRDNYTEMYGCINREGKIIIPYQYDILFYVDEGLLLAFNDEKMSYINSEGKVICDIVNGENKQYVDSPTNWFSIHDNTFPYVTSSGEWGVKSIDGKVVVPAKGHYKSLIVRKGGYIVFRTEYGSGIMDKKGNILIKDKYEYIPYCDGHMFIARMGNEHVAMSMDENTVSDYRINRIASITSNGFVGIKDNNYVLLNEQFKLLKEFSNLIYNLKPYAEINYEL